MTQEQIKHFIRNIRIEGNNAFLPSEYLDRRQYEQHVKKHLDNLGGRWNSKLRCYEFPYDPSGRIRGLINGNKVKLSSKYQYFDTPIELVDHMFMFAQEAGLDWSKLDQRNANVLDPGAGRANILKNTFVKGFKNIYYYELMPENRMILEKEVKRLNIPTTFLGDDFFDRKKVRFDLVIANPPFRNDKKHIKEMFQVALGGGFILTLGSESLYNDLDFINFLDGASDKWEMREVKSDPEVPLFEGTNTGCTIIVARKTIEHHITNTVKGKKQLSLF